MGQQAFKGILHPCTVTSCTPAVTSCIPALKYCASLHCDILHLCSETPQFGLFGSQGGRGSVFLSFTIKNTLAPLNFNTKTLNESSREHCVCVRCYHLVGLLFNWDSNILIKYLILGASGHYKTWACVSEHGELSCKFRRRGTGHGTGFHTLPPSYSPTRVGTTALYGQDVTVRERWHHGLTDSLPVLILISTLRQLTSSSWPTVHMALCAYIMLVCFCRRL